MHLVEWLSFEDNLLEVGGPAAEHSAGVRGLGIGRDRVLGLRPGASTAGGGRAGDHPCRGASVVPAALCSDGYGRLSGRMRVSLRAGGGRRTQLTRETR